MELIYSLGLIFTFTVAFILRARALSSEFPYFDGGMFYAMVGDLKANGYLLPHFTSYNGGSIPFSYPPLAFYVTAAIEDVFHTDRLRLLTVLPALANFLTVAAFFSLARAFFASRWTTLVATCAFAFLPQSFVWFLAGGGLTRSFGLLFAVMALGQILRMYTRPNRLYLATSGALTSLTILSHLEMTLFLGLSATLMFLAFGRTREGLLLSAAVISSSLVLTSPWWLTIIQRQGLSAWLNAGSSRSVLTEVPRQLLQLRLGGSPIFDALGFLALLGIFISLHLKQYFLVIWVFSIAFLMPWIFDRMVSLPVSLLVGVAVMEVGWPWLNEVWRTSHLSVSIVVITFAVLVTTAGVYGDPRVLKPISAQDRGAMLWVRDNTDSDSAFVVITGEPWERDIIPEWFPVLANRRSVMTVQGTEWLGKFGSRIKQHQDLEQCIVTTLSCLQTWEATSSARFTDIYVTKSLSLKFEASGLEDCCSSLRQSLRKSPDYAVIYDGLGATIFQKRKATAQGSTEQNVER